MISCLSNIGWLASGLTHKYSDICQCLQPDKAWHKVKNPKADYSRDKEEGKVGNEPRLEPCWSELLIDPLSAMWV